MPRDLSFLAAIRLLWLGASVASLAATVSGYPEAAPVAIMLSFPASVVVGIAAMIASDATMGIPPIWLQTLLFGTAALLGGYLQWFVVGRSLATRILARRPPGHVLHLVARAGTVFVFVALAAVGTLMMHAQQKAVRYYVRAKDVREGMTLQEVRSILGEPRRTSAPMASDAWSDCEHRGAVRVESYWFEYEWLPRRLASNGFVLAVCTDQKGRVLETYDIWVD